MIYMFFLIRLQSLMLLLKATVRIQVRI